MKIRNIFLLAVFLLFNEVQSNQNGASLNSLIQELAPIARLTNGIAIQTELSKDSNKMNELVAEFLGVGSGDDVARLKQLKVDEVAKELGELYATVEKVPELNVDMAALANSFNALETMKHNSAVLDNKNLTDPSEELKKKIEEIKKLPETTFNKLEKFETIAEKMKYAKETSYENVVGVSVEAHLIFLKDETSNINNQLSKLKDFKTHMVSLLELEDIKKKLKDFSDMAIVSRLFNENFSNFSSMGSNLKELKTGVDSLKSVTEHLNTVSNLAESMTESWLVVKKLTSETPTLRLTVGFSGGIDDLKLMLEDLDKPAFKKVLSRGKDTKNLKKELSTLAKFHSHLQGLHKAWVQVAQSNKTTELDDLTEVLPALSASSQKTPKATTLTESLNKIEGCFANLKAPTTPDFTKATALTDFATRLEERIGVLKTFLESQKTEFESVLTNIFPLITLLKPFKKGMSLGDIMKAWAAFRNVSEIDSIVDSLNRIHGEFKKIEDKNPYDTLDETIDFSVVGPVLKSLDGTNLDGMLACLQKNSYNPAELDSTLNFGKSVQEMKNKKTEVDSMKSFLTVLTRVKTGLLEVQKLTSSSQKPKLRRRRAPNQKSLANLKTTVATDFGRGVQVLREFTKILENEASVKVAVEADDGLKKAISAIPGVQSVWTDDNRKGMGKMVVDLNDLDKYALTLKKDNMTSLWTIFDEAQKIQGVEIADAKVFEDPISIALAASADPKIKGTSGDFKNLGALDLNFAQNKLHLKAAALTFQPLQQFFDDYFGNSKTSGGAQASGSLAPTDSPTSTNYGLIGGSVGGVLLLVGLGVGGYFLRGHLIQQYRWKNRERYWIYEIFRMEKLGAEYILPMAALEGRVSTVKRLIAEGRCVDMYMPESNEATTSWRTALHAAVDRFHPEIVELLILAGADRSLLSSDKRTAEQQVAVHLKNTAVAKEDVEKLKKIEEIFKKYEKKRYKQCIGELLPVNQFCIDVADEKTKITEGFRKKFRTMLFESNQYRKATHAVLETNAEGILDLDPFSETKQFSLLWQFFKKQIPIQASWLESCLKDPKNFRKDYDYRITKIKYNQKVYDKVDEWRRWINWRHIPCFYNVVVTFASDDSLHKEMKDYVASVVRALDGTFIELEKIGDESGTSTPYWFPEKSRYWVVYDKKDKTVLENRMKLFYVKADAVRMTVEEFFDFLLSLNGPPARKSEEEPEHASKQGSTQGSASASVQGSARGSTTNSKTSPA